MDYMDDDKLRNEIDNITKNIDNIMEKIKNIIPANQQELIETDE